MFTSFRHLLPVLVGLVTAALVVGCGPDHDATARADQLSDFTYDVDSARGLCNVADDNVADERFLATSERYDLIHGIVRDLNDNPIIDRFPQNLERRLYRMWHDQETLRNSRAATSERIAPVEGKTDQQVIEEIIEMVIRETAFEDYCNDLDAFYEELTPTLDQIASDH